jgi:lipopolysaccharide transport system permease protein
MFASPVVYPLSIVPQRWRVLYAMNPLVGVISGFRSSLLGQGVDWSALAVSTGVMLVLLAYATFSFRRTEKHFADIV